jgi:hypothetical protein
MAQTEFDIDRLGMVSKRLASAVFAEFPELIKYPNMDTLSEIDGLSLVIKLPSPTGDEERALYI